MAAMPPLPPLNLDFGSNAFSSLGLNGATWTGPGSGAWTVNVAGSGLAMQSASALNPWLIAGAIAAAYLIFKK